MEHFAKIFRQTKKTLFATSFFVAMIFTQSASSADSAWAPLPDGDETVTPAAIESQPAIMKVAIDGAVARENKIASCKASRTCGLESDPLRNKCEGNPESCNIDCTGNHAFDIHCAYSNSGLDPEVKVAGTAPEKKKKAGVAGVDNNREVDLAIAECEDAEKDAGSSCDENQSDVSYWRNRLSQFSTQLSQLAQVNPGAACSQMSDISAGISGSVGAWKAYCQNKISNCTATCGKSLKAVKGVADASDIQVITSARAACVKLNNKTGSAEVSLAEAQRTAQAAAKCRADAISQQQAQANANFNNPFNGQAPALVPPGQRSFTPPELGGRASSDDGDERASGRNKGSTLLGGGPGATDGAPSAAADDNGGRAGRGRQNQALPAQSGISGKIGPNGNSLTAKGPQQRPNYFNNATSLNAAVYNGSYGAAAGGAARTKNSADEPAALKLRPVAGAGIYVNGKWVAKGASVIPQNKAVALRNKVTEEFRKGYRTDDGRSMAATTGPDGVTGPKSNLFFKIRTRYSAHFPNMDQ